MPHEIRPLTPDDFPDLSRFLTGGFHAPCDAPVAALDVLRWKYWDPAHEWSHGATLSYLARDVDTGRVVGHVGVCPTRFRGGELPAEGISALHGMDWLGGGQGRWGQAALAVAQSVRRGVHRGRE